MYRISIPLDKEASSFADTFAPKLLTIIEDYLYHGRTCPVEIKGFPTVHVGVARNSITRLFLNSISNINSLKMFLKLSPLDQIKLIKGLHQSRYNDDVIFKKLTKGRYLKYYRNTPVNIDHFFTICYDVFVTNGFEDSSNPPGFLKRDFIVNSHIKICPYCGEEKIEPTATTKKQIDHFLPKSKYPFLGFCFYNLIPSCIVCNNLEHKRENDPLYSKKGIVNAIANPYLFNPKWIRFHIDFNKPEPFNDDDFEIVLGFKKQNLLEGYDEFFDISDRMSRHKDVVGADFRRLLKFKAEHFYGNMQIDANWLQNAYDSVISTDKVYDYPEFIQYHRLRRDVFEQLLLLRRSDYFYTRRSPQALELLS